MKTIVSMLAVVPLALLAMLSVAAQETTTPSKVAILLPV